MISIIHFPKYWAAAVSAAARHAIKIDNLHQGGLLMQLENPQQQDAYFGDYRARCSSKPQMFVVDGVFIEHP